MLAFTPFGSSRPARIAGLVFVAGFLIACIATAVAGLKLGSSPRLITGDAIGYYSWLRSIVIDGDLDFSNDYSLLFPPDPIPPDVERLTAAGLTRNKYPTGLAVIEAPGFFAGHLAAIAGFGRADGASAPYQLAVTVWLQLFIIAGFVALWRALVRAGSDPGVAGLLVASGLVATNLVNYVAKEAAMAHGAGAALLSLVIYALVRARDDSRPARWIVAAGGCLGLALICRPTNAAFVAFLLPLGLPVLRTVRRAWVALALPVVISVAIHVALTSLLNGRLAFSGYEGESFTAGVTGLVGSLFSPRHGLFVYSPWYPLMIGLSVLAARAPRTRGPALGALASFAILWIANGTWWNWWFGAGFGNRAFIESIPVLIVPVALWMTDLKVSRRQLAALAACLAMIAALNFYLWVGYAMHRYPAEAPSTFAEVYLWAAR